MSVQDIFRVQILSPSFESWQVTHTAKVCSRSIRLQRPYVSVFLYFDLWSSQECQEATGWMLTTSPTSLILNFYHVRAVKVKKKSRYSSINRWNRRRTYEKSCSLTVKCLGEIVVFISSKELRFSSWIIKDLSSRVSFMTYKAWQGENSQESIRNERAFHTKKLW